MERASRVGGTFCAILAIILADLFLVALVIFIDEGETHKSVCHIARARLEVSVVECPRAMKSGLLFYK